ncbi:9000_t:CDS:2, partial [Racocetra persica]
TFKQTTKEQRLAMVMFIENSDNRDIIDGRVAIGAPVSGKPLTKNAGFAQMTLFVNKRCKNSDWSAKIASGQWATYKKMYMETHRLTEKSGWGLTEEDNAKGINTIDAKLEELCLYYSRIDLIYGKRQNIQPAFLENFGLNGEDELNGQDETEIENNIQNQYETEFENNNQDQNETELYDAPSTVETIINRFDKEDRIALEPRGGDKKSILNEQHKEFLRDAIEEEPWIAICDLTQKLLKQFPEIK